MITNCRIQKFTEQELIGAVEKCTNIKINKEKTFNILGKLQVLGKGAYGKVYAATRSNKHQTELAIKVIEYDNERLRHESLVEIEYGTKMAKAKIGPKIYDILHLTSPQKTFFVIIMEKYPMDGNEALNSYQYSNKEKRKIIKKMIKLIIKMLEAGLYCFDIKPSNFVVKGTTVRMIDFGGQFCNKTPTIGADFLHKAARTIENSGTIPEYSAELKQIANSPKSFATEVFFQIIMLPFIVLTAKAANKDHNILSVFDKFITDICENTTMKIAIQIFLGNDTQLFNTFFHYIGNSTRRPIKPSDRVKYVKYFLKTFCQEY